MEGELALGHNTLAALLTRGLHEITRLGIACGGQPRTFAGLATQPVVHDPAAPRCIELHRALVDPAVVRPVEAMVARGQPRSRGPDLPVGDLGLRTFVHAEQAVEPLPRSVLLATPELHRGVGLSRSQAIAQVGVSRIRARARIGDPLDSVGPDAEREQVVVRMVAHPERADGTAGDATVQVAVAHHVVAGIPESV